MPLYMIQKRNQSLYNALQIGNHIIYYPNRDIFENEKGAQVIFILVNRCELRLSWTKLDIWLPYIKGLIQSVPLLLLQLNLFVITILFTLQSYWPPCFFSKMQGALPHLHWLFSLPETHSSKIPHDSFLYILQIFSQVSFVCQLFLTKLFNMST